MSNLKYLTLFRERMLSEAYAEKPSLSDHINYLSKCQAIEIAKYMENSPVLIEFVSPTPDPYDPKDLVKNVVYSDGQFAWDGIIVNWVKKYRVRLPLEFMNHLKKVGMQRKVMTTVEKEALLREIKLSENLFI